MLVIFSYFLQNPYSGTLTRTREPWPVLKNLDPYSGTLNLYDFCTQVPEFGRQKKSQIWFLYNKKF